VESLQKEWAKNACDCVTRPMGHPWNISLPRVWNPILRRLASVLQIAAISYPRPQLLSAHSDVVCHHHHPKPSKAPNDAFSARQARSLRCAQINIPSAVTHALFYTLRKPMDSQPAFHGTRPLTARNCSPVVTSKGETEFDSFKVQGSAVAALGPLYAPRPMLNLSICLVDH
jgi:hypothetical protein